VAVSCLDDGAFRFTRPNGQTFDSPQPLAASWEDLLANQPIRITPQTAITGWTGEQLDVELAVDGFMQRAQRMKDVSAGTSA
jgi:hypothetical protein